LRRAALQGGMHVAAEAALFEQAEHRFGIAAVQDHRADASLGAAARGQQFGAHAAGADRAAGAAGGGQQHVVDAFDFGQLARAGVASRVRVVDAVDVGRQHQQVGLRQHRHMGSEAVVVADPQFIDRDRIVLVDHRQHAETAQRAQRVAGVEEAPAVAEVVAGQQQLGDGEVEEARPEAHQFRLADRRQRLLAGHARRGGITAPAQGSASRGHRAGGHHHHLAFHRPRSLDEARDVEHVPGRQRLAVGGDQVAADLQDQPAPGRKLHGSRGSRMGAGAERQGRKKRENRQERNRV